MRNKNTKVKMADDVIELHVWKGDWDLPSIDPNCLAVLAYCRFSGVPIRVRKTGNPLTSPSWEFPVLKHKGKVISKVPDIMTYLRKERWGSDFELTSKQCADVVAFSAMLEEKLLPAILHLWWMDNRTFIDFTRPWWANIIPFPFSMVLPGRRQKAATLRVLLTKGGENVTDSEVEAKIYKEAKECLNLLSYKLGKQDFFFGKSPTSLDALVFGYLSPILKAPLPSNQLQSHLLGCENLCKLCHRILHRYLPVDPEEAEAQRKKAESRKKETQSASTSELTEFPNRRRNMLLAAIFALTSMTAYAIFAGLIQVRISDDTNANNSRVVHPTTPAYQAFDPLFQHEEEGGEEE